MSKGRGIVASRSKLVKFKVGDIAVHNSSFRSPIWRVREVDGDKVGVVDAMIEHRHSNLEIQWLDSSILERPTMMQMFMPQMQKLYDEKNPQGAADLIADTACLKQEYAMDAAFAVGFVPEYYVNSIRVHMKP